MSDAVIERAPVIPPVASFVVATTVKQGAAASGSILASITSGIAVGGALIGIAAGIATVISLVIFATVTVKKGRRDYEQEMRDAEARGEDRQKEWTEYWKAMYLSRQSVPVEPPPAPRRRRGGDEDPRS